MKVNVSGGSAGTITIQLSDVAYTCPPGVGIPVSLRNSVMEPAQYWLGFGVRTSFVCVFAPVTDAEQPCLCPQTEEDGALSVEVLVTPPDGSTPHRPPVVVHSPKPPPRRQVLTSVVSPDAMALDHGDGQPHSPQRYTEVIGDADGHEDDEDADSAQPPVIDTKQNLPPLDSLVQLSLLGVQSGLRVDVKALTEAALSESNTSMLDVMQVRCAPAPNPVDGHLISVDIPKWAFWWMQAQRIQVCVYINRVCEVVIVVLASHGRGLCCCCCCFCCCTSGNWACSDSVASSVVSTAWYCGCRTRWSTCTTSS